jgi:hypothetical protein
VRLAQARLVELLAKQSLHELVAAFSRAADRLDAPAMAALFHPDATVDSGVVCGPPDYFATEFVRWVREHARVIFHSVSNELFRIEGARASGESHVLAVSRLNGTVATGGRDHDVLTAGRYLDRFEQRAGEWRFTARRFVLDYSIAHEADQNFFSSRLTP